MKSKPPNKKTKVEVTALGPPGTPETQKSVTPSLSPAGSTSSTTSSLLSIGPPYSIVRPVVDLASALSNVGTSTGSSTNKASNTKAKAGGGAAALTNNAEKGSTVVVAAAVGTPAASTVPSYPIFTHFNLADFPKINACIQGSKGGIPAVASNPPSSVGVEGGGGAAAVAAANKPIDSLTMEDIDTLQAELETLWSSVAARIRVLHKEQGLVQSTPITTTHHSLALEHFDPQHQEKIAAVATIIDHGTRTSVSAAAKLVMASQLPASNSPVPSPAPTPVPTPSTKRSTTTKGERLPKKKLKGEAGKSKKGGDKPPARATQNRSHSVSSDLGDGLIKHFEAPNQFWDCVDSYCKELQKDDMEKLAGIIEDQEKVTKNFLDIPPLGKHFRDNEETSKLRNKEYRVNNARDYVGPLTQRLVAALVEERVSMHHNNCHLNSPKEDASLATSQDGFFVSRPGLVRALGLDGGANTPPLENRIRECLVDQGLLLPDDANDPILLNPDDEVLAEIKRSQSVYKKLHQYNSEKLLALHTLGSKELDRNTQKRELEKADKDVLEAYKTVASCRLKKKPLTKKEKDAANKALEARKKVLGKLGSSGSTTNGNGVAAGSSAVPVDPSGLLRVQV
ncbi:Transcriptional adapter 3-B [Orchesella cincta]|uniref:Transcriptional adapter 3-B n=1 Tax=Orchesella cincta TaxID=48709 RepID=A0A1D2MP28_ORCCI|nr:Transcriptional adapter 3-B [Orchesella cincta]